MRLQVFEAQAIHSRNAPATEPAVRDSVPATDKVPARETEAELRVRVQPVDTVNDVVEVTVYVPVP